jgi:hypothetical protein
LPTANRLLLPPSASGHWGSMRWSSGLDGLWQSV